MTRSLRITMMAILVPVTALLIFMIGLEVGRRCMEGDPVGSLIVAIAFTLLAEVGLSLLLFYWLKRNTAPLEMKLRDLERTNARIDEMVESAQDLIVSFDKGCRICFMNRAGMRLLEIPALAEPYLNLIRYIPEEDRGMLSEGLRIAADQGHWTCEMNLVTGEGQAFAASIVVVAHRSADVPGLYYSAIARDVTEQRMTQTDLRLAKEHADKMHADKSEFLAWAGHEIRTPLHAVIGLARLVDRAELSPLHREYIDQIEQSSSGLLQTLNDMLDLSKLEADRPAVESFPFPFDAWMLKLERTMRLLLGAKPLDLRIHVDPNIPELLIGDGRLLEQALANLVGNAVKFTAKGMIELTVALEDNAGDRSILSFEVRDTGIGMTEQQLMHLYEPYRQADPAISRQYGGTGLGLVITKKIVERMGGSITERSVPGVGTTFRIVVPLMKDETSSEPLAFLPCKVLFIHDEESLRAQTVASLSSFCEAAGAAVWEDAFGGYAGDPAYDLILVDMEANEMAGFAAWYKWKRACDERGIALVAYTNLFGRRTLHRLPESLQPAAVIVKPAGKLSLYRALMKLMKPHWMQEWPEREVFAEAPADMHPLSGSVLLVEDHEINRAVAIRMLLNQGCHVETADSGLEALERLTERPYDLILMDLHMPGLDGVATAREIRRQPSLETIPIVVLTADTTLEQQRRCHEAGIQEVILKPYEPARLRRALRRWLPSGGLTGSANASPALSRADEGLPGLHAAQAIARMEGNVPFYARMLGKFRDRYESAYADLADELGRGDLKAVRRRLHALRGASSHLSLYGVYEAATALESLLSEEEMSPPPDAPLSRLAEQLAIAIISIGKFEESVSFHHKSGLGGECP
ncbi:PAS domain-containing hybrid sensor histidine kinase/response regulator [Cohnella nanjingensis]|uniref:Circadian input-output histidine kinase CikA n=1 Tax=Cohnella nanjingensis TaxID=1387779 RepID=A0A7X0RKN4_9BACL|nr:PAS domain-containing hybrid sensor histidine kinase/response regulator [Cohnella nanjingensis]MBB6669269.1 response regulator [Cohnella nanjingensis]